jgi:hypothetical protein
VPWLGLLRSQKTKKKSYNQIGEKMQESRRIVGKRTVKEIVGGLSCPKCGKTMQRYEHAGTWVPHPWKYHFSYWDRCMPCRHMQHYEAAKVYPDSRKKADGFTQRVTNSRNKS